MTLSRISQIALDELLIKVGKDCVTVFGPSRRNSNLAHHFSFFGAPPPGSTQLEPHLTRDDPGVPAQWKERIYFRFAPEELEELLERFRSAMVSMALEKAEIVTLEALDAEGWCAIFVPLEVLETWLNARIRDGRARLTMRVARELFDASLEYGLDLCELPAVVDEDPDDRRRRAFSILRVSEEDGVIDHDFLHWAETEDGRRVWFRLPSLRALDQDRIAQLLAELCPPTVLEAFRTILEKLGFEVDEDAVATALEHSRAMRPS